MTEKGDGRNLAAPKALQNTSGPGEGMRDWKNRQKGTARTVGSGPCMTRTLHIEVEKNHWVLYYTTTVKSREYAYEEEGQADVISVDWSACENCYSRLGVVYLVAD
jgi:hypothetical protein